MLKKEIAKMPDDILWMLLGDIAEVMTSREGNYHANRFWLSVATEIKSEIDSRMCDE